MGLYNLHVLCTARLCVALYGYLIPVHIDPGTQHMGTATASRFAEVQSEADPDDEAATAPPPGRISEVDAVGPGSRDRLP